jgi:hypothetical protein
MKRTRTERSSCHANRQRACDNAKGSGTATPRLTGRVRGHNRSGKATPRSGS